MSKMSQFARICTQSVVSLAVVLVCGISQAANVVPNEVKMPGTQPGEVLSPLTPGHPVSDRLSLDPTKQCTFCHGKYNLAVEPEHSWQGSMMSHASRDPLFWATLAVAEQDFDGSGDLCLRCHTSNAWLSGRSVPTDGSALTSRDVDGIQCDTCHRMTNPNGLEHKGVQIPPFIANNEHRRHPVGYYGSAQYVMLPGNDKLGPYSDAVTKHPSLKSDYHRSPDFCGTCHDVSNPVTGDLAHNNGAQFPLRRGTFSGVLGSPVDGKAAFNNFPYAYGIVERTYSEFKASRWPTFAVKNFNKLPKDLRLGSIKVAYDKVIAAGTNGDYEDGATRYYICQTCHMSPVTGQASSMLHNVPKTRKDLALHDLTGGNYWIPEAIKYADAQGTLRLGGGLKAEQIAALDAGVVRAKANLSQAATLSVKDDMLKVINLTGHKLISGYPEGRRMWLNTKWYDNAGRLLREDGKYGPIFVTLNGVQRQVNTIMDLHGANTRIYEVHGSMTQEWAKQLLGMGKPGNLAVSFDRITGSVTMTLQQLANKKKGTYQESFHFVLNNHVALDNRIPPYGMKYSAAKRRNALPVPYCQYGCPSDDDSDEGRYDGDSDEGTYNYYDKIKLNPPRGAKTAKIDLLYQPTSWEYIQFLYLANQGTNSFLADEGKNLLDAWLNTGMAEPYTMATAMWADR